MMGPEAMGRHVRAAELMQRCFAPLDIWAVAAGRATCHATTSLTLHSNIRLQPLSFPFVESVVNSHARLLKYVAASSSLEAAVPRAHGST
jgi:hypothetical protein